MNKEHIENKEVLEVIPVEDKTAAAGVQGQPEQQQRQFVRGDRSVQNKNRRFGQGGPQSGTGTQQGDHLDHIKVWAQEILKMILFQKPLR